jgi:hypothetical protein
LYLISYHEVGQILNTIEKHKLIKKTTKMKKIFIITTLAISIFSFAQIGINTPAPAATLDVVAKNTNGTSSEGIIAPRLSGDQIKSADAQYATPQMGAMVYATNAVNGSTAKTVKITAPGYYYFDGAIWQKMGQDSSFSGDIKHSARTADHGGWYLLNGRAISTLPVNARNAAASLGFTANIPDATDRVLKTKTVTEVMAATGGVSTISIARANLPNINFSATLSGNTTAAGAHAHSLTGSTSTVGNHQHGPGINNANFLYGNTVVGNNGTGNYTGSAPRQAWNGIGGLAITGAAGSHNHSLSGTAASAGNHTHSFSNVTATIPTGGTGQTLDNRSPYLSVNTFIYLGE